MLAVFVRTGQQSLSLNSPGSQTSSGLYGISLVLLNMMNKRFKVLQVCPPFSDLLSGLERNLLHYENTYMLCMGLLQWTVVFPLKYCGLVTGTYYYMYFHLQVLLISFSLFSPFTCEHKIFS